MVFGDSVHVPFAEFSYQPFPVAQMVKASAYNAGDPGSIPGLGRSRGEGNGNLLQYSHLETCMDGGAWWATVHGVAKSQTRVSNFTFTFTNLVSTFVFRFHLFVSGLSVPQLILHPH